MNSSYLNNLPILDFRPSMQGPFVDISVHETGHLKRSTPYLDGLKHGKVKGYDKNGKISYVMQYCRGKLHGNHIIFDSNENIKYIFHWKNGQRHGFGFKQYKNGSYYIGEWKFGNRHGNGQLLEPDGTIYKGEWYNDKKHGHGIIYQNGKELTTSWCNDKPANIWCLFRC